MNVRHYSSHADFTLQQAVLIYTSGKEAYASLHSVIQADGVAQIGAGTPATREGILAALQALAGQSQSVDLIHPRMLLEQDGLRIWWSPPGVQTMYWTFGVGAARQPALIWCLTPTNLVLFATRSRKRPTLTTRLAKAPYWNIWDGGRVCTGSMHKPAWDAPPEHWEEAFFRSTFSHPNDQQLAKWIGGIEALWREQMANSNQKFPNKALVSTKRTLGSLIKDMTCSTK